MLTPTRPTAVQSTMNEPNLQRSFRVIAIVACFVTALPAKGDDQAVADQTQRGRALSLFDGRSLDGFEGDRDYWRVEGGAIVGEIPQGETLKKNTWLIWRGGELADFDLRLQFRLTGAPAANSGIQFRCQVRDVDHVSGYQADLDQGATWLGRIYDEHGRALLAERGSRVSIAADGQRTVQTFAPAAQYAVLFRENAWNDYRILAISDKVAVFVNGTLFCELRDGQLGERDLLGALAFQLHSGPETKIEFRNILLEHLSADDERAGEFEVTSIPDEPPPDVAVAGVIPSDAAGEELNLGFELGSLAGWTATGDAFDGQPVNRDSVAKRWPGQTSQKNGEFFIGGYEIVRDHGVGTLRSAPFVVTHPYASFLIGGGQSQATRLEIIGVGEDDSQETVIFSASGKDREEMRRVAVDLHRHRNQEIALRLVDESAGGWGHLNFDDFRFHEQLPDAAEVASVWRSTKNPLLQHLVRNPRELAASTAGAGTVAQMFLPRGFSADVVAAEPDLYQPMAFTFDARGRLWVVEGNSYPVKRPEGEGLDRILIFSDDNGDGDWDQRKVFAEGLNLVSGMELGHGGVWVGAAPQLLFIPDRDADDVPDGEPEVMLNGFGFADTHETINSFRWGPDGWLYGNQGVFNKSLVGAPDAPEADRIALSAGVWRYHPTRHVFEVFAHGGSNQWGLDYDDFGQFFMTHCRSYWGEGPTTHVLQGGHYWNQVNSGYAPFVSAAPLPNKPWMRNYLLASARYGHGEGGAGKPGSGEVYGGHSHVGTMIYLGDNWPAEYRNHLFTHNLHGHQINHQVNLREAGGFNTVHAGYDVLFCADPQYIGVDLKCGPDGAVYISDWYDQRHCHNPDSEQWDRGSGRLYRVKYDANYRPSPVDYANASDEELAAAQLHANDWHVRTARRVLSERATQRSISEAAIARVETTALEHPQPARRLRAVWALHGIGRIDAAAAERLLVDENEYVRGWMVQLAVESLPSDQLAPLLEALLEREQSLLVRRYLASAIQRVPRDLGWTIAESLASDDAIQSDRDLPLLLWYGLARLMDSDADRGLALAQSTPVQSLRDYIRWYAAKRSDAGRAVLLSLVATADEADRAELLSLLELAIRGMRGIAAPTGWEAIGRKHYASSDRSTRQAAESLGAAFGDPALYQRLRSVLADASAELAAKRRALLLLEGDDSAELLPLLLDALDEEGLVEHVLPLLSKADDHRVAEALIARLGDWNEKNRAAAMEVLSSRVAWSESLLDAIARGDLAAGMLTAFNARQMASLGDERLNERLKKEWGALGQSSEQLRDETIQMVGVFQTAPLWAYSAENGAKHFKALCATCHEPGQGAANIAPPLAGSGSKGIEYIVENVFDPNAVIGRDFQARVVLTTEGRVINGLVLEETDSAITLRTANNNVTIAKDDIEEIQISPNSFMPEGLLNPLNEREKIELFKYLMAL